MKIETVPIDSVVEDPANVRQHPQNNMEAIKGSLAKFGQQKPIVVGLENIVIAGNGTLRAARDLGWMQIKIVRTELKGTDATAFAIADNRTSELAEWDTEGLGKILHQLQNENVDLGSFGWAEDELNKILTSSGLVEPSSAPAPLKAEEATTKPGDLFKLGRHFLLCGDSSKPEDVDRLLQGNPAHLVNTDPPYNINVEPRSNNAIAAGLSSFGGRSRHQEFDIGRDASKVDPTHDHLRPKDRPIEGDFISDEEFERLLMAWFGNISRVLIPGGGFYIWGGYLNMANYPKPLDACGLYFSQMVIWVKESPVLTRKDFMGNHEWCFYGWKKGAAHKWYGPDNVTDVWSVKKISHQNMVHLTEKPVELATRAIQYSSLPGQNILDLFGGSGSTLMGAEQTDRNSFLMEIDPLYCDVIIKRWEEFGGRKAERVGSCPQEAAGSH